MADSIISNVMVKGHAVVSVTLIEPFEECSKSDKNLDGRDGETRTHDLLLPKQALYQLSYVPTKRKITGTGLSRSALFLTACGAGLGN